MSNEIRSEIVDRGLEIAHEMYPEPQAGFEAYQTHAIQGAFGYGYERGWRDREKNCIKSGDDLEENHEELFEALWFFMGSDVNYGFVTTLREHGYALVKIGGKDGTSVLSG